ncbi:hypothetical protein Tco_0106325, partial [Tanacetum coccineum]
MVKGRLGSVLGVVVLAINHGVLGRWEWVGVSCDGTWDSGKARKTMGKGGLRFWRQGL